MPDRSADRFRMDPHISLASGARLAAANLKRCPLCGAVNAVVNQECFICRWHGAFYRNPAEIEEGLAQLLDHCPELVDVLGDVCPPPRPSTWQRLTMFFHRALLRARRI